MRLIIIAIFSLPMIAFAQAEIKITSFVMSDHKSVTSTTAELCGTISDKNVLHEKVIIISDPGRAQGYYVASVTPTGSFCHVIRTTTRQASVTEFVRTRPRLNKLKVHSVQQ